MATSIGSAGFRYGSLYESLDSRMAIAVWETNDPTTLYLVTQKFAPWADNEIILVIPATEGIAAVVAAGLYKAS